MLTKPVIGVSYQNILSIESAVAVWLIYNDGAINQNVQNHWKLKHLSIFEKKEKKENGEGSFIGLNHFPKIGGTAICWLFLREKNIYIYENLLVRQREFESF